MKTKFALAFYYIVISFLAACAAAIVIKLIFWPPCTQYGNTCVIDPWSTAGLAGTVLAVAATVLAILGAVAVAAWWTSLNDRVNDQVKKLYETQKVEINTQVDTLLDDQRRKVDTQLEEFQTAFRSLKSSEVILRKQINLLHKSTQDVEEMAIEGITSVFAADFLEQWAQKSTEGRKFPRIFLRMAGSYLNEVEHRLPQAESSLEKGERYLESRDDFFRIRFLNAALEPSSDKFSVPSLQSLQAEIRKDLEEFISNSPFSDVLSNWDGALRWFGMGMDHKEFIIPGEDDEFIESLTKLRERVETLTPKVEQLKQNRERLVAKAKELLLEVNTYIAASKIDVTPRKEQVQD
jgi:hypothetical protein